MIEFKPQLVGGRIFIQGNKAIFESLDPFAQVILPLDMADILVLCDGSLSLGQILERVHFARGTVPFRKIVSTLLELKKRGLLVNGEHLDVPESVLNSLSPRPSFYLKPLFQVFLGRQVNNDRTHPLLFFILSLCVVAGALAVLLSLPQSLSPEAFLRYQGSYLKGAGLLLLMTSLLLSLRNALKFCLLLFLTGRVYNLRMQFNGLALYFNVGNEALFLVHDRWKSSLYHISLTLSYFLFSYLMLGLIGKEAWLPQALWAAILLTFIDLDPFRQSDLSRYFRSFMDEDSLRQVSLLLRNNSLLDVIGNKPSRLYGPTPVVYLTVALLWSVALTYLLLTLLRATNPYTLYSLQSGQYQEALPALLVFFALVLGTVVSFGYTLKLLLSQVIPRLLAREKELDQGDPLACVIHFFSVTPIFRDLPPHLLQMVVGNSNLLSFESGEPIIFQGSRPDGFYMIVRGAVQILVNDQVIKTVRAGGFFGEIALLANSLRTATVQADQDCLVLKLEAKAFWQMVLNNVELALFFESISQDRLKEGLKWAESSRNFNSAA